MPCNYVHFLHSSHSHGILVWIRLEPSPDFIVLAGYRYTHDGRHGALPSRTSPQAGQVVLALFHYGGTTLLPILGF